MQYRSWLPDIVKKAKEIGSLDSFVRYHPVYYARALHVIRKFNDAGLTERKRLAEELRTCALGYALRTPYGKQLGHSFEGWPVLEKATLRDNPGICSTSSFPAIPAFTGGTSGLPLRLLRSFECIAAEQAFIDSLLLEYGLSFRSARIAVLRAGEVKDLTDNKPPFGSVMHGGKRLTLSNAHMSRHTIGWFVSALKEFQPNVFWVYPSMLANMLYLMEEAGLNLQIPIVLASSEIIEPGLVSMTKQKMSATVIDYYGQGERVCFAYATRSEEYWFSPAYGYVELQPQEGLDTRSDTRTARIISTNYWNNAMPLVRYNTGDLAIIPSSYSDSDIEEVGFGTKPFLGIAGRSNEFIIAENGKRVGGLNHLPRGVDHILRLQVVQESLNKVTIKVLARPAFNEHDRERIYKNAIGLIPHEIDVTIEVVSFLESTPNSKTPFVIRRI